MPKKRPVGRPAKPKREKYRTPQRQFGRVADETWQELKDAATNAGKPFTQWALEILLRAARRKWRDAVTKGA